MRKRKWIRKRKLMENNKMSKQDYIEKIVKKVSDYQETNYTEKEVKMVKVIQRFFKTCLMKKRMKKLSKNILKNPSFKESRNRNQVFKEIMSSERIYVDSLKFLVENYLDPLENSSKNAPKVTKRDV